MSGPKVVRIVTRDEAIATCRGELAKLDAALKSWARDAMASSSDIEAATRRRDQIADLLAKDRFLELQKEVSAEIGFLQADKQERLNKAALAEARARTTARRQQEAAMALLNALHRAGRPLSQELEDGLAAAAQGKGDVAAMMRAGFELLSTPSESDKSHLHALAQQLKENDRERSLTAWLENQPPSKDDLRLTRVENDLSELVAITGHAEGDVFERRLAALQNGEGGNRRALLLDSLILDIGTAVTNARRIADIRSHTELALAELRSLGVERKEPTSADSVPATSLQDAEIRLKSLESEIARLRDARAAEARRRAVLDGLASLGYEAGEQLSTAWVQDGRIVLRRPAQPGYGVELSGDGSKERVQMRVVAFGESVVDPMRDRDAETLWCGDVATLRERLASTGTVLTIEKALPVGAVPLKRIAVAEEHTEVQERFTPHLRQKSN